MRIVIAGGSGFLGRRLTASWLEAGDDVTVLTRTPATTARVVPARVAVQGWNPPTVDAGLEEALRGADAVVNLAGAPIGGRGTTPSRSPPTKTTRREST
jgi:NAD dependent epimerase/dehydratase family enzyme